MKTIDLRDFIEVTTRNNKDEYGKIRPELATDDKVFLPTLEEIRRFRALNPNIKLNISDYGICTGGNWSMAYDPNLTTDRKYYTHAWLSDCDEFQSEKYVRYMDRDFGVDTEGVDNLSNGILPMVNINLKKFEKLLRLDCQHGYGLLNLDQDTNGNMTICFGKYPQELSDSIKVWNSKSLVYNDGKTKEVQSVDEREKNINVLQLKDGSRCWAVRFYGLDQGKAYFFIEQPIVWYITNWKDLPKSINPFGTGRAKNVQLFSKKVLQRMKFASNFDGGCYWKNSYVRSFLNGKNYEEVAKSAISGKQTMLKDIPGFMDYAFVYEVPDNHPAANLDSLFAESGSKTETPKKLAKKEIFKKAWEYASKKKDGDFVENVKEFIKMVEEGEIGKADELLEENTNKAFEEHNEPILKKRTRLARLNPDDTPESNRRLMSDTELIKSWVDAGQSVLLRGPSGIGKTERLKSLYPDLIYIKLTNNMFPEKVVGSVNLQTGQNIPPDFAKQAILSCATSEERKLVQENIQNLYEIADEVYERSKNSDKKTVILLDELLNVKPAVQSLVYTLVLNRIVETGNGLKLPANTVVVATGNQKKYSAVAEDLAEPLEKRFDHILDMQPKVDEWISEYAIPKGTHPAVVGYILEKFNESGRSNNIGKMGYFYEEPEVGERELDNYGCRGRTNDPRGWVSVSNTLYAFEKNLKEGKYKGKDVENILEMSLESKLRNSWASEFYDFYNVPALTVKDVISGEFDTSDLPQNANERFATMTSLLTANMEEVEKCRIFVRTFCDSEYVSLYDILWAGNDDARKEYIAELQAADEMRFDEIGQKEMNR